MTTPLIHARGLSVGYGRGQVVSDLDFSLAAGQVHGLIGPNGAGKTTLLRALAGRLLVDGRLTVFGAAPFDNPVVLDRTVLAGIDAPLPEGWNLEKVCVVGAARHRGWRAERAEELARRFEVPRHTSYSQLSRGQKSAASIVYACASGCELMLLDEPYLGFDAGKREAFYRTLREEMETQPRTIVMSTHHLHESERLLDSILFIDSGCVRINGPVGDIAERIIELTGPAEEIDHVLNRLGVRELSRTDMSLGSRSIVDLREKPELIDAVFDLACHNGGRVRVAEVTLEKAVAALGEEER
ncbi:ABC transporter ATP-binding protein YtrB [Corynebacterium atrinae]|uniref:ATP-binding cassette domain-containing protein n=1 Tax=Corynebacterium atrinae TaxID=1336740 RepID=UPI0025B4D2DA|nr:ATP-binding cassette domain-containing protein [Corynebacterium atrinae]WJY64588.1 ABC transporter ATP-binding protein YtrB [Corynebacterium atrinae]